MKALLIIVFSVTHNGTDRAVVSMDSMSECEAALEAVLVQDWPQQQRETIENGSFCVPFPADNG